MDNLSLRCRAHNAYEDRPRKLPRKRGGEGRVRDGNSTLDALGSYRLDGDVANSGRHLAERWGIESWRINSVRTELPVDAARERADATESNLGDLDSLQIPVSQHLNGSALRNDYILTTGFRLNF